MTQGVAKMAAHFFDTTSTAAHELRATTRFVDC